MEKESINFDRFNRKFGERYSLILTEPDFERRLKNWDPNLKLMFDQHSKRWCILEWSSDNSGWNLLMKAEDEEGNPTPLGDWVFNKLYVWRDRWLYKMHNPDQFLDDMIYKAQCEQESISNNISDNNKHLLLHDRNDWRRAARELKNFPTSDVTAGYPKNPNLGEENASENTSIQPDIRENNGTSFESSI